jgi:hypothetical protein
MKWKAALAKSHERIPAISYSSQKAGALRLIELLGRGIPSPIIAVIDLENDLRGRESELNAIRVLNTLPYVTQIQDQPNLADRYFARKIDLLVQLRGRRVRSVYVQVKSSQSAIDAFIAESGRIYGLKTVDKTMRHLLKQRIILLNGSTRLADSSIQLDFEQQLRDIEMA